MKKHFRSLPFLTAVVMFAVSACSSGSAPEAVETTADTVSEQITAQTTAAPEETSAAVTAEAAAPEVIDLTTNEGIAAAKEIMFRQYVEDISDRKNELFSGYLTVDGITQRIFCQKIGKPDANGYPLYIALRGGGVGDKDVANEQFEVMKYYYNNGIDHGIYIAPLCIRASWDEHFRPESFGFYDRIIEDAIAFYNVDPDRVYLIGFSSGGDGVYAVSPRIADRFAAVNMSAGYPNEQRVENMANLPICIQVGENDTAYDRNIMAAKYDSMLSQAARNYNVNYIYETFIHKGGTHNEFWKDWDNIYQPVFTGNQVAVWLRSPEKAEAKYLRTSAVDWVNQYTRDPLPETVVWNTDVNASLRKTQAFYWLDRDGGLDHSRFKVSYSREGNSVNIEKSDTNSGTLKIYLCPEMLDVFGDVNIITPDGEFTVRPVISEDIMRGTLQARGDMNYIFASEIDVVFRDGKAVGASAADRFDDSYTPPEDKPLYRWSENGIFYVDNSLFGLSYDELCEKLGEELPGPLITKAGEYHNCNTMTYCSDQDGHYMAFMFQNGKCAVIYGETEGKRIPLGMSIEKSIYLGEYVNGLEATYYLSTVTTDSGDHIKQEYMWHRYQRWNNMDGSLDLTVHY